MEGQLPPKDALAQQERMNATLPIKAHATNISIATMQRPMERHAQVTASVQLGRMHHC